MIRKHSVTLHGHRTSLSLEDEFWAEAIALAAHEGKTLAAFLAEIDETRAADSNLSSAIRLRILAHYRKTARNS